MIRFKISDIAYISTTNINNTDAYTFVFNSEEAAQNAYSQFDDTIQNYNAQEKARAEVYEEYDAVYASILIEDIKTVSVSNLIGNIYFEDKDIVIDYPYKEDE